MWSRLRAASLRRLDKLRNGQPATSSSGVDIRDRVIDDVLSAIGATIASIEVEVAPVGHEDPGARLNTVLAGTVPPPGRSVFAALEVACLEEHEAGLPGEPPGDVLTHVSGRRHSDRWFRSAATSRRCSLDGLD